MFGEEEKLSDLDNSKLHINIHTNARSANVKLLQGIMLVVKVFLSSNALLPLRAMFKLF